MRLLFLYQFLALFFCSGPYAQSTQENHLDPNNLQNVNISVLNEKPLIKNMYRFPAFLDGEIILHNGETSTGKFNYNISRDQMHFLGKKNDTFYVSDPVGINFIRLGDCRFYYHNSYYLQSLFIIDGIVLAFRQNFVILSPGLTSSSNIFEPYKDPGNFDYYTAEGKRYRLSDDLRTPLKSQEFYYFGDQYGNFVKAGKRFILDHYSKHQADIRAYIKAKHIHFTKPDEMKKLLQYCAGLKK